MFPRRDCKRKMNSVPGWNIEEKSPKLSKSAKKRQKKKAKKEAEKEKQTRDVDGGKNDGDNKETDTKMEHDGKALLDSKVKRKSSLSHDEALVGQSSQSYKDEKQTDYHFSSCATNNKKMHPRSSHEQNQTNQKSRHSQIYQGQNQMDYRDSCATGSGSSFRPVNDNQGRGIKRPQSGQKGSFAPTNYRGGSSQLGGSYQYPQSEGFGNSASSYYSGRDHGKGHGNSFRPPYPGNRNWQSDRPLDSEVELSKEVVRILRHGKFSKMIPMDTEGYVFVVDILKCKPFRERFPRIGLVDIQHIVESNNKKRFEMKEIDGEWKIKAAQGHSVQVANLELTPITDASKHPVIVHGTYWENWDWIKEQGLHRMQRSHIHFAEGLPGKVISGMRQSSQVSIYLDLEKALNDGLKFFQSSNKVVLTEGDIYGRIHPKYFKKVEDCRKQSEVYFKVPPEYEDAEFETQ